MFNAKTKRRIPYGRQWIDEDDIQAVLDVLKSDYITQGPFIDRFEKELASYCGSKYAVAVSSGTAALHLACLAAGIKSGDEVITSPVTFIASANCILYCGGKPVFSDIDPETINIDPGQIKKNINKNTKALIPVHFAGLPCDMEAIHKIAKEHNLTIIEDACHALGAKYKAGNGEWVNVGSCSHSDMAVFSFHPVKHITTGEGGAITTNDEKLYKRLKVLRTHGVTRDPEDFVDKNLASFFILESIDGKENQWYYEMHELGYNYRITDFQCALGLSQLNKIAAFINERSKIADIYTEFLRSTKAAILPAYKEKMKSSWHIYCVQLLNADRKKVIHEMHSAGINVQVHYLPVHLQPYYKDRLGYNNGDYPLAERYFERTLTLPLFPRMKPDDVEFVARTFQNALKKS